MGGANIICGDFEGSDKSGSPIGAVLKEAYRRQFGRMPRGKTTEPFSILFGTKRTGIEGGVERALIAATHEEVGKIPSEVCSILLPHLKNYQTELLARLGIENDPDQIADSLSPSSAAKYGTKHDDGWQAYCLHDLVIACEKSVRGNLSVEIIW